MWSFVPMRAAGRFPETAKSSDVYVARSAAARLVLGDKSARSELVNLLLSTDLEARKTAHTALANVFGGSLGYDPEADLAERRSAARRWQTQTGK